MFYKRDFADLAPIAEASAKPIAESFNPVLAPVRYTTVLMLHLRPSLVAMAVGLIGLGLAPFATEWAERADGDEAAGDWHPKAARPRGDGVLRRPGWGNYEPCADDADALSDSLSFENDLFDKGVYFPRDSEMSARSDQPDIMSSSMRTKSFIVRRRRGAGSSLLCPHGFAHVVRRIGTKEHFMMQNDCGVKGIKLSQYAEETTRAHIASKQREIYLVIAVRSV